MIIYNVTINIENTVKEEWHHWMVTDHIPKVMATGFFSGYTMLQLLNEEPNNTGTTYAIQYRCDNLDRLNEYLYKVAPALQQEHLLKFKDRHVAFRTFLQVLKEG